MITEQDQVKSLQHQYGGNGYAVVQWLPDDMCRVVSWSFMPENAADGGPPVPKLGNQALLAWRKLLSPEKTWENNTARSKKIDYFLPPPVLATQT